MYVQCWLPFRVAIYFFSIWLLDGNLILYPHSEWVYVQDTVTFTYITFDDDEECIF